MKVNEISYTRIESETLIVKLNEFADSIAFIETAEKLANLRNECLIELFHYQTMASIANMRFTLNTKDEFYQTEKDYYDETAPKVQAAYVKYLREFLKSIHIKEVTYYINPLLIKQYELSVKCIDDKTVPLLIEENKLVTSYTRLMAETIFEYNGEKLPLSALKKYFASPDREVRKNAYTCAGETLMMISDKLNRIYDKMVKLRHKIALSLGYENFVELGDNRMGRTSYNREMIAAFRENVKNAIVPIVGELKESVKQKLQIETVMLYDNETYFTDGTPTPILSPEEMFEAGREMYSDMSDETGEFFNAMISNDAFDVFPREGKWGGGYCTSFIDFKQPFILANFNGTAADVDVLTHEAGHAFADYMMYKQGHDIELNVGGMETAETHSMSMEFFCWKYMNKFFGQRTPDYKYSHLADALTFIPYGVIVDYFQEKCYRNPQMTPSERNKLWLTLEREFRPYLSVKGIPYLENGTRWQYQMHIFENPLYYIDYCIAQSIALQFLTESQRNYSGALFNYIELVKQGGEKDFSLLVTQAGLASPFTAGTLEPVSDSAAKLLKSLEKKFQQ